LSIHVLPKYKDKLKKEDPSQPEKLFGEQNKLSKSSELNEAKLSKLLESNEAESYKPVPKSSFLAK